MTFIMIISISMERRKYGAMWINEQTYNYGRLGDAGRISKETEMSIV